MQLTNEIFFAQIEQILAKGEEVQLRIQGYSMRPLLRNGRDVVILSPYRDHELHLHDIVLFRYKGRHILHRIVQIDENRLTIAGDGNYRKQEQCTKADVIAVARCIIRPDGREIFLDSKSWRRCSQCWLFLPSIIRRYILALLFRLGYK